jgi:hypothetical protein
MRSRCPAMSHNRELSTTAHPALVRSVLGTFPPDRWGGSRWSHRTLGVETLLERGVACASRHPATRQTALLLRIPLGQMLVGTLHTIT